MQQIKIFKGMENDVHTLEELINNWIRDNDIKVQQITGNISAQSPGETASSGLTNSTFAPSDVLITVLYRTE